MSESNMTSEDVIQVLDNLMIRCKELDASDIHLAPDSLPYLRVHGILEAQTDQPTLTPEDLETISRFLAQGFDQTSLETTGSLDGACSAKDQTRYRFNIFRRQGHLSIALRRLEDAFRSLSELGFADSLYELCDLPDGLVVVAGPTGSGKSTTLATLIDRINQQRRCHIVTIEDPIEYLHQPKQSLVNQRQVGVDTSSFNDALVASLRQDPDVILVGEIRDLATIRTAITASETGHLVFTTVHARDCAGTIERLVSVFPADEQAGIRRQLSLVLRAVITQHLLIADGPELPRTSPQQTVRRSRVVVSEVMMVTGAIANLIATGKTAQIYSSMESGGGLGMQTLEQDLAKLLMNNSISEKTALGVSRNPNLVKARMEMLRKKKPNGMRYSGGPR